MWLGAAFSSFAHQTLTATERLVIKIPGESTRRITLSPSGKLVAGGAYVPREGNQIFVWDTTSGKLQTTLKGRPSIYAKIHFSPDDSVLTAVYTERSGTVVETIVKEWSLATGDEVASRGFYAGGGSRTLSATGKFLLVEKDANCPIGILWDLQRRLDVLRIQADS